MSGDRESRCSHRFGPFRKRLTIVLFTLASSSGGLVPGDVVINEVHYHPDEKTVFEEFLELYNAGETTVDLSGWFFSDGISYTFPEGATIAPGEYLVLAEDPETLESVHGVEAFARYEGRIANEGERLVLRNPGGGIEDRIDYRVGFPWPIASDGRGSSMELVHPTLDNDLGGSWRASGKVPGPPREREVVLPAASSSWRWRKGTSEASDPPSAWRELDFEEDDTWFTGQTPVGFGDDDDNTVLDDMRESYSTVFLRHEFEMGEVPDFLTLAVYADDGCVAWINGFEVARVNVIEGNIPFNGRARRGVEAGWTDVLLPDPSRYVVPGKNVIAVHGLNQSARSGDFSIDVELRIPGSDEIDPATLLTTPSPGFRNAAFTENPPPQVRQVRHLPAEPRSDRIIAISARVTDPDGVASVEASYQVVPPGGYIPAFLPLPTNQLLRNARQPRPRNPEFEDPANWTTLPMVDDGAAPDVMAGDGVYTAVIPAQENRTLLRYRVSARDRRGAAVRVPYPDDRSLNFAAFVYDGIPPYVAATRSVHPDGPGHVYGTDVMTPLPVYFLITRAEDLRECIAYNSSFQIPKGNEPARDKFNWEAAFFYNGVVYDHMRYRLRQANDRYGGRGKRSMRFRFNRGSFAQLHDNYGRPYPTPWRTINTGKMFDNKRVGNFGLTETLNHILWNMVGVPSPWIHTFHLRVVDGPEEAPGDATGQYLGDFWGMFIAIEDYDPRFMDTHGLEDGNLYKLKDGIFNGNELRRNQGRYSTTTDDDFQNIRRNLRPERTTEWLEAHVNYERWYPYHAVVEAIRHYDFRPADSHSKNRAWYFEPDFSGSEFGRVWTLPWDSDASWGPNWNSGIDYSKNAIFAGGGKPAFKQKYRNTIREFRDLLWTEEVIPQMIDDLAAVVGEFSMADRDRWRGAPPAAGTQDFGPMAAKVADMKRFAFVGWSGSTGPTVPPGGRARHLDALAAAEGDFRGIPETPEVMSNSPAGFPLDGLSFVAGPYSDPQNDPFGAMEWRVGEVTPAGTPFDRRVARIYEWEAVWESGELHEPLSRVRIPATALEVGHTYRVRARFKDATGRWGHWSEPVEFTAGPPATRFSQQVSLRVTEVMYNPFGDSGYEFIELQNTSSGPLDLADVSLRDGIEFSFAGSAVTELAAGEYVLVVENLAVFRSRYDTDGLRVAGEYAGRLSNGGERIEVVLGRSLIVQEFAYDDAWHPTTDGLGRSLVILDPRGETETWSLREAWRPSAELHGSPGRDDVSEDGLQLPGDLDQNGRLSVTDVVGVLRHLFLGSERRLPCGTGALGDEANLELLDADGSGSVNVTDAVRLLAYLFQRGAPHALGAECVPIPGCPDACGG